MVIGLYVNLLVGFFWGGSWVLANKDTKVPKAVGEIIEWITLDASENGLQYYWANGTLMVKVEQKILLLPVLL